MPTSPIRRVRSIVTGVAGSPYYVTGYFTADTGTATQCITAWHTFITGVASGPAGGFPVGSSVRTDAEVQVVDPVTGNVVATEIGGTILSTGSSASPLLPKANQFLIRWRTGNFVGGREVRGKTFLPLPSETASTDAGLVEAATLVALSGRAGQLISNADTVFVVWSRKNGLWWAASNGSCWEQFAILRSRRD